VSLYHVIVYNVSEVEFSQAHEIELILDSLGSYVFVKIYDILIDVICPYLNFAALRGEEQIGLFAIASRRIALQSLIVEGFDVPSLIYNLLQSAANTLSLLSIMYVCEETG
jgi:hypothetical protein